SSANAQEELARTRWTKQAPIPTSFGVEGVAALSSTDCWVAAAAFLDNVCELARTTDAGRSWTVSSVDRQAPSVTFVYPWHGWPLKATVNGFNMQMIQFFDALEGWAIGGDAFYHTTDGGNTWTKATVPANTWAYGANFLDRLHGIAVGEAGNVVRTVDGGATWQRIQPQGSGQRLWSVKYSDLNTAFFGCDNGAISRSVSGGATWASIQSGGAGVTHKFDFVDGRHAWAGQDAGEIVYTLNGGRQWI